MRLVAVALLCLSAGLTAGCASNLAGSVTADATPRPGYRGDGIYVLPAEERAFECQQLAFVVGKSIQQLNAMPALAQKQRDAPPDNMMLVVARWSGSGIAMTEDFDREKARSRALGQLMAEKGCPPIDIDGQTKAAEEKIAVFRAQ